MQIKTRLLARFRQRLRGDPDYPHHREKCSHAGLLDSSRGKSPSATALPYSNPPAGWKEYLRYYPVGTIPESTAQQWVEEAERLYLEVIGELQKDGEI